MKLTDFDNRFPTDRRLVVEYHDNLDRIDERGWVRNYIVHKLREFGETIQRVPASNCVDGTDTIYVRLDDLSAIIAYELAEIEKV